MEQIENIKRFNWEKKIEVSLTIWELQMIRDAFAITNQNTRSESFLRNTKHMIENPYETYNCTILFNNIEEILKENGGVILE